MIFFIDFKSSTYSDTLWSWRPPSWKLPSFVKPWWRQLSNRATWCPIHIYNQCIVWPHLFFLFILPQGRIGLVGYKSLSRQWKLLISLSDIPEFNFLPYFWNLSHFTIFWCVGVVLLMRTHNMLFHGQTTKLSIQSSLVISNSKGLSKILWDIRTSTYQICRLEEKINRTTALNKCIIGLSKLEICWKYCGKEEKLLLRSNFSSFPQYFVPCY